jgi:hypothetical protein
MDLFNRGELSALVRIQYEERMAAKLQRKREMAAFRQSSQLPTAEHVGGLDFSPSTNSTMVEAVIRASKRDILRHQSTATTRVSQSMSSLREVPDED